MASLCSFLVFFTACFLLNIHAGVQGIGVNYGTLGDNLPPPSQVVALLKSRNVARIRLFDPNPDILTALQGSGIAVALGVRNQDLEKLSSSPEFATEWVANNLKPYAPTVDILYVTAGNEVIPGELDGFVLGAMQNLDAAIKAANFVVPVSTAISLQGLGVSYPPSSGAFTDAVAKSLGPIAAFLASTKSPLVANVYPYFSYASDPANIKLDYALFQSKDTPVLDGGNSYNNLFDAMVDATYSALEKVGGQGVDIVVGESGWPSAGGADFMTVANAQTYVNNLIAHVSSGIGTPKKPGKNLETYIFALFNENQKSAGAEQNFGLFHPDMTEVYHANL